MSLPEYQYEPLTSEASFRILRLLPAQPWDGDIDIIRIEILEANLDNPPEYEAVSYAWGVEEATAAVVCNGKRLCVTPNVFSILRVLRPQETLRSLWLDSIAINQSSIAEKNIQVPKMRSVYQEATQVLVWLGEGSFEVDAAFEHILEVSKHLTQGTAFEITEKANEAFHAKVSQARGYYDPIDTSFIADLLNLPWFSRTWTVQEMVLGREVMILLGTRSLPWESFSGTLRTLVYLDNRRQYRFESETHIRNPASFADALDCFETLRHSKTYRYLRSRDLWAWRRRCIHEPLRLVRKQQSSDPKDKVYGVYGIFEQTGARFLPQVDYVKSVQQVYTEITRMAIETEGALNILQELRLPSRILGLPSWVPDWSNTEYIDDIKGFSHYVAEEEAPKLSTLRSKLMPVEFHDSELILSGILTDEVVDVALSSSVATPGFRRGFHARRLDLGSASERQRATINLVLTLQAWNGYSRNFETYPVTRQGRPITSRQALWTLIGRGRLQDVRDQAHEDFVTILTATDVGSRVSLAAIHDKVCHKPEYASIKQEFMEVFACSSDVDDWPDEMKIRLFLKVCSPEVNTLQHDVSLLTYHRTLFKTREGYMGLGPRWTKKGDCIAWIAQSDCLFVVRRVGSKYRFVGPATIHEDIDGERWDESRVERMTFI